MATILEFRASKEKPPRKIRRRRARRSAEIVIFPGVRYERWSEQAQADQPTAPAARDTRQIGD